MADKNYIDEHKTSTFKKGDVVIMSNCIEAELPKYKNKVWTCRTDSYRDKAGQDVVFLENFSGCFLCGYLTPTTNKEE